MFRPCKEVKEGPRNRHVKNKEIFKGCIDLYSMKSRAAESLNISELKVLKIEIHQNHM